MGYRVVLCTHSKEVQDELIAVLSTIGYEGFQVIDEQSLSAYIKEEQFDEEIITETIQKHPLFSTVQYTTQFLEEKNWNEIWESSFEPIQIGESCLIRASFHPSKQVQYEVVIDPEMAFGTGHHATTSMMIQYMLNMDFSDKRVLDFGCGTAILSILAEKMGAKAIDAVEIDSVAYENAQMNVTKNGSQHISLYCGDEDKIPSSKYHCILANVNLTVLEKTAHSLSNLLEEGGTILMSGILDHQKETMQKVLKDCKLKEISSDQQNNWVILEYRKI